MNFRKVMIVMMTVTLLIVLCACSTPEEPAATPMATPAPTPSPKPVPTSTAEPALVLRSYTTGIPVETLGPYKPIGVMIENNGAARPQSGLQAADIVYEAPVEGCTRFFCIFNDTLPEKVGPVRSARLYYIRIQQEWDCAYVHFGGPESGKANVYTSSSDHIKLRVDFIKGKYCDYYWRQKGKSSPHNAYTNVKELQTLMTEEAKVHTFQYADTLQYTGPGVTEVSLPFYSDVVTYKYSAEKDIFERYMDEKPFIDEATGEVIQVKNLIVQYNEFYHGGEAKGRWLCEQLGSGKADFFVGGKHITGTWEKETYDTPTVYKDGSGNEIVLQPGNTWIAVHPDDKEITVS